MQMLGNDTSWRLELYIYHVRKSQATAAPHVYCIHELLMVQIDKIQAERMDSKSYLQYFLNPKRVHGRNHCRSAGP